MRKIIIAEDEHEIGNLLKRRLEKSGYDVIVSLTGLDALVLCKNVRPDLVLLDIGMPGLDGYQTCERIRQDSDIKDTKILFLTGKDLEPMGVAERCREMGVSGYISKISSFDALLEKIKEVIG